MNVNDISGFDAMTEEIRYVYAERDRLRDEVEALRKFKKDICEAIEIRRDARNDTIIKALKADKDRAQQSLLDAKTAQKYQEDFTEEAASILGVHPGDLTLSDILDALKKLKRYEELNNMNCEIIADLKTERDKLQQDYLNELGRRKTAERYISDSLSKICSALGIECSPGVTIEYILDTIDDLRGKNDTYSHSFGFCRVCEYLGIEADGSTLSDIRDEIKKLKDWKTGCTPSLYFKWFKGLCDSLGVDRDSTTWQDIFTEIEGLRAKYLNLCGDFACCCDKLGLDITECNRSDVMARIDVMNACMDDLKADTIRHDKRRREWVRKYKSEHERANSCDELYKKYKALYDADAPARKKLSDDIETYRSSYEAVKNVATKNRSLMNTVAQIVGTVGMHDDVTMAGVQNAKKKANHWDILVDSYGEGTMRSLLDNVGIDVSGDKGNGLFR